MKKSYKLKDLDCANCAAKMERAIAKLPQIESVTVSFFTQKMVLIFADDANEAEVLAAVKKTVAKVEPDCEVLA